jgi:septal ring-binding cell division protein DamX
MPTEAPTPLTVMGTRPEPTRAVLLPTQPAPKPSASAVRASSPRPTAAAPRPTLPAAAPRAAPAEREVPTANKQAWLDRAARDRQRAAADRRSHYTIQLELACEVSTLLDAWKYDRPAGTLWVLTTPFDGKTCFRVLWGRYPSREAARRALSGVPSFFSTGGNRPVVTAIR